MEVDELPELFETAYIESMPTFQFYQYSKLLHEIIGGQYHEIVSTIQRISAEQEKEKQQMEEQQ